MPSEQSRSGRGDEIEAELTRRERAAGRIQALVDEHGYGGFASLALEEDPPSVVLFWKGPVPPPVQDLVDQLGVAVRIVVRDAVYSLDELLEEARRIAALDQSLIGVKIWVVGPLNDCTGLSVEIDRSTDLARAKREITSPMKLEFSFGGPIVLL